MPAPPCTDTGASLTPFVSESKGAFWKSSERPGPDADAGNKGKAKAAYAEARVRLFSPNSLLRSDKGTVKAREASWSCTHEEASS